MGKMIRKNNAGTRRMACRLTEAEKSKKRRELEASVGVLFDIQTRHDGAKLTVKAVKDELDEEQARHDLVGRALVDGEEERSVEFDEVADYDKSRVIEVRADTQEVCGVRDMRDAELNQTLSFVGEEVQDSDELKKAVVLYFNRAGKAERVEVGGPAEKVPDDPDDDPDFSQAEHDGVTDHPANAGEDLGEEDDDDQPETHRADAGGDGRRLDDQRAEILSFAGDLEKPEDLHQVLCALGYWMPVDDVELLDETEQDWIYRSRAAWQAAQGLREPVDVQERPEAIPAPSVDALGIQTDEDLVVALIRCGYWMPPTDLAGLQLVGWEERRHFAANAEPFDLNQSVPQEQPEALDAYAIDQVENLGALLFVLGHQILDDSGRELDAFDPDDQELNGAVAWAALAFAAGHCGADPAPAPPEFLEPFQIEPESPPDPSAALDLVNMAPAALDAYLAELVADKKDGLKELRILAQELAGDSVETGFYNTKARKTCVRAILAMVEEQREAAAKAPWDEEPADPAGLDTSDLEPSP